MVSQFYFPFSWFSTIVSILVKDGKINKNDNLNILVKDSTGKIYKHSTRQKYSMFILNDTEIIDNYNDFITYL